MKRWRRPLIALLALLAAGALRLPVEAALSRELRAAGLIAEPLGLGTRERIGQTSVAVALGGLRTLVATFVHLQAFTAFTETDWAEVEKLNDTTVDLAPRTPYYWIWGFYNLGTDAASYYQHDETLPPLRAAALRRSYIRKGREFIERGIRNLPDDPNLPRYLGALLADSSKNRAFGDPARAYSDAADAYALAAAHEDALPYVRRAQFLALARAPERHQEALELGRTIYREGKGAPPVPLGALFALEMRADPERDPLELALELYDGPEDAYRRLAIYWEATDEAFPMDGVADALAALELRLLIPPDQSVLEN